jgi:hypothetical protein
MIKVFVECRWFVNGFDIDEILRLSHVLECEIWFNMAFIYDEGYLFLPVFISADAEEIIKIFCEIVQPHARFVQCKLASLTDFQREKVQQLGRGVSLERYKQLLTGWSAHNKRIEKGLPFWTHAFWTAQAISVNTLIEVITLAEISAISIGYSPIEQPSQFLNFYFKVASYHQFDVKLNEIGHLLQLEPWRIVRRPLIVEPEYSSEFAKIKALPRLTHDTIPAFLDAIKPHL